MTIIHRRLLYICFFILFFVSAPLVIYWAEGYRLNPNTYRFQKTGVLFLESKPKNANIYLNDDLLKDSTTARIKNLLPGDYQITLKKEGYLDWQKKLTIFPQLTTFAQYIRLFLTDSPTISLNSQALIAFSNQAQNKIALLFQENNQANLLLFNSQNQNLEQLPFNNLNVVQLLLNPQASHLFIQTKDNWFDYDLTQKKITTLTNLKNYTASQIKFDPKNDQLLYVNNGQTIIQFNLIDRTSQNIVQASINDFIVKDDKIIYLITEDNQTKLLRQSTDSSNNQIEVLDSLPLSKEYVFYDGYQPNNIICLIDQYNQQLYIFDFEQKLFNSQKTIVANAQQIAWYKDQSLLFYNDFEVWVMKIKDKKYAKQLITRLSTPIKQALWFTFDTHLLYLTSGGLYISEVLEDTKQTVHYEKIKGDHAWLNDSGNLLFWLSPFGLYQSQLQ